jgi:KDO2-lipid IV(A) lauroyltransferase
MSAELRIPADGMRGARYWPTWLLWKMMRLTHAMPLRWHRRFGQFIGTVFRLLLARQRRIARINIEMCFPNLSAAEREQLLRAHFRSLGMSFFEMGLAWFAPIERIRSIVEVHGLEHLQCAIDAGQPVLLWGAHFTCLEMGVRILEDLDARFSTMHKSQSNVLMDQMIITGRSRFAAEQIPRDGIRRLLARLKAGDVVVYFPDQAHVGNQSAMLPFFGVPAATNTAASRLAQRTGAQVLTYFYRRLPGDTGYRIDIGPPLENMPSDDADDDARRLFGALEAYIRLAPEQYLWTYKKFKRRPPEYPNPYA